VEDRGSSVVRSDNRSLSAYAAIACAFEVREAVQAPVVGTSAFQCRIVSPAYWKDYDAIPGNHPRDWPLRFAVDRAEFLAAYSGGERVGGAVAVVEHSDVTRLGGVFPLALLWDLRVAPEARGLGVGRALLAGMEERMRELGAAGIVAETQDINVAACRLYASAGYRITRVDAKAYAELPGETQIIWTKLFG
jgi:ribosomal protein S18 acetylase RimI-like enzyme